MAKRVPFEVKDVNVQCGSFSKSGQHCRLRLIVSRDDVELDEADKQLVQAQLRLRLKHNPSKHGDVRGQGTLVDTGAHEFDGVCEVGIITVNKETISFSTGLPRDHESDLGWFAGKRGQVSFVRLGDAKVEKATETEDDEDDDDEQAE